MVSRSQLGEGVRQREQQVLRVPDRREGAWHTPEEQEVCVAGTEGQGPIPQGPVGLGRARILFCVPRQEWEAS